MKCLIILFLCSFIMISCSTAQLVESWKNPNIDTYEPQKVLVVGMTSNTKARQQFEELLKDELDKKEIEAVKSLDLFEPTFTVEKKSEADLKRIEDILIANGFDTILFTKVIGVEDKIAYNYAGFDETHKKFNEDYLMYQDIFYNPDYYDEYSIYHAESSMYCICQTKDRELIWKGYIDIIDPESVNQTIDDYVRLVIVVLEEQQLLNSKIIIENELNVEAIN